VGRSLLHGRHMGRDVVTGFWIEWRHSRDLSIGTDRGLMSSNFWSVSLPNGVSPVLSDGSLILCTLLSVVAILSPEWIKFYRLKRGKQVGEASHVPEQEV